MGKRPITPEELSGGSDGQEPILTKARKSTISSRDRYHRMRAKLIEELGGVCAAPGCGETDRLQFDHVGGTRTWDPTKRNRWTRLKIILKEISEGVAIRPLCVSCNSRDANLRRYRGKGLPDYRILSEDTGFLGVELMSERETAKFSRS